MRFKRSSIQFSRIFIRPFFALCFFGAFERRICVECLVIHFVGARKRRISLWPAVYSAAVCASSPTDINPAGPPLATAGNVLI